VVAVAVAAAERVALFTARARALFAAVNRVVVTAARDNNIKKK